MTSLTKKMSRETRDALLLLPELYGGAEISTGGEEVLPKLNALSKR
jgi:hypothetical protein